MPDKLLILKNIPDVKWIEDTYVPICREHNFELDAGDLEPNGAWTEGGWSGLESYCSQLRCLEGPHIIELPALLEEVRTYIRKKLKSKQYSEAKLVDIDGLLVPVSKKDKVVTSDDEYFIRSQVKNSKRGDQLVVYAGRKGQKDKTQIFIDPEHKKMSFDQNDLNPSDVFVKLEATFRDGSKHIIQSGEEK